MDPPMSNALPLLRAVRARLADEARWTKGDYSRDANGIGHWATYPEAVCWCIAGARDVAVNDGSRDASRHDAFAQSLGFANGQELIDWNDAPDRTHADIIARLDEAIEREENHGN